MDTPSLRSVRARAEGFVYRLLISTVDPREAARLIVSAVGYENALHDYIGSVDGSGMSYSIQYKARSSYTFCSTYG